MMTFGKRLYNTFWKEYNEVEGMVKNPEARPRKNLSTLRVLIVRSIPSQIRPTAKSQSQTLGFFFFRRKKERVGGTKGVGFFERKSRKIKRPTSTQT